MFSLGFSSPREIKKKNSGFHPRGVLHRDFSVFFLQKAPQAATFWGLSFLFPPVEKEKKLGVAVDLMPLRTSRLTCGISGNEIGRKSWPQVLPTSGDLFLA